MLVRRNPIYKANQCSTQYSVSPTKDLLSDPIPIPLKTLRFPQKRQISLKTVTFPGNKEQIFVKLSNCFKIVTRKNANCDTPTCS